jgi:dihydroflavonol-4-reductase
LNVVDVRDVAVGLRLAAERGKAGERYILGGVNLTLTSFFGELAKQTRRTIPRVALPSALSPAVLWLHDRLSRPGKVRPVITADQARLAGWYFCFDCSKAARELGYCSRPLLTTLADTYSFWMPRNAA